MSSTLSNDPRVGQTIGAKGTMDALLRRVVGGQVNYVPVIIGIVLIWVVLVFLTDGAFASPRNLVNLSMQLAATGTIALGLVFVLLLGEIDLSAGAVSGLAAAVVGVTNVNLGVPGPLAVLLAIATGAAVGAFQGSWITAFRVPAFIVTLAGLLAWDGLKLFVLGDTGSVNVRDPFILSFTTIFFDGITLWLIGLALVAYVTWRLLGRRARRNKAGLAVDPIGVPITLIVVTAVAVAAVVLVLNRDRGLSLAFLVLLILLVLLDIMLQRTRVGRMIFAIGGNAASAVRAGLPVRRVTIFVFVLGSSLAAFGGVIATSRSLAVTQSAGTAEVLLNAIAAVVIGGTSLFGGRGGVWSALLGIFVIQSISNGMDLLSLDISIKLLVTGAVLLLAVTFDAVTRTQRSKGTGNIFARLIGRRPTS